VTERIIAFNNELNLLAEAPAMKVSLGSEFCVSLGREPTGHIDAAWAILAWAAGLAARRILLCEHGLSHKV
jgi:hypothetical protein